MRNSNCNPKQVALPSPSYSIPALIYKCALSLDGRLIGFRANNFN